MDLLLWFLVLAIAAVKILSFAVSVRRALRPRLASSVEDTGPIDPPDSGPDWDWWERDLLPPDPNGTNGKQLNERRELVLRS